MCPRISMISASPGLHGRLLAHIVILRRPCLYHVKYPVLSCLILSRHILSCLVMWYPAIYCLTMSYSVLSFCMMCVLSVRCTVPNSDCNATQQQIGWMTRRVSCDWLNYFFDWLNNSFECLNYSFDWLNYSFNWLNYSFDWLNY
jgi:hypothetical protein